MKQNKMRYINLNTQNISTLKIHKPAQEQYDRELAAGLVISASGGGGLIDGPINRGTQ